jgi:monofunctional biosynthetic peptidoglycan transglycosylase
MAKRVDLSNSTRSSTRGSKFSRFESNAPKQGKWTINRVVRRIGRYFLYVWISTLVAIVLLKFIPVYFTPTMASRKIDAILAGEPSKISSHWTPYEQLDRNAALAVIASEDQLFPVHHGFDFDAMWGAVNNNLKGKRIKGASTISQQVAKNVFLWQGRSYIRKGLEAYFTLMIELIWGKKRILEVYLNIAETGKMTFGVEAASRKYYGHSAEELSTSEAARIAACLPNPIRFSIKSPSNYINKRTQAIKGQMKGLGGKKYLRSIN